MGSRRCRRRAGSCPSVAVRRPAALARQRKRNTPYEGATTDDWSLLTGARLGVIVPLHSRLSLAVEALGVATWPPAAVRIGEVESARFGAPSVLLEADLLGALQ